MDYAGSVNLPIESQPRPRAGNNEATPLESHGPRFLRVALSLPLSR